MNSSFHMHMTRPPVLAARREPLQSHSLELFNTSPSRKTDSTPSVISASTISSGLWQLTRQNVSDMQDSLWQRGTLDIIQYTSTNLTRRLLLIRGIPHPTSRMANQQTASVFGLWKGNSISQACIFIMVIRRERPVRYRPRCSVSRVA